MAHARNSDPETSFQAAVRVKNVVPLRLMILRLLAYGPMTDGDIAHAFDGAPQRIRVSPSGLRTRRAELVSRGLVRDSGERRLLSTGRKGIAWELVPELQLSLLEA